MSAASPEPLRIGMLGAGLIAGFHALGLDPALPARITAVYDPVESRAESMAARLGALACASESEVLDQVDAVYICTWTSEHPRLVAAAAARGIAVFCEKPLATDLPLAREMTEQVTKAGIVNQVGLVLRHTLPVAWMRTLLADPAAGRVMSIVFRDDQYIPIQGMYASTWRADVQRAGAGVLIEHSIHDLDIMEHMIGPIESISGTTESLHGIAGIEDAGAFSMRFESGAVGSLTTVWHDILERPSGRSIEIFCERLWCALSGNEWIGPVQWRFTGSDEQSANGPELRALVDAAGGWSGNQEEAFVNAAREERPATPDFADALRAHVVVDAAYRAAATGERIAL